MSSKGDFRKFAFITILYLGLTTAIFFPIASGIKTYINGSLDDAYAIIWHLWWFKYSLLDLGQSPSFSSFIESPFGIDLVHTTIVNHLIALPFTWLWGPVASYNIMILLSFFISALAMYLLAFEITKSHWPSFFAGAAYSFSPYHTAFSASGGMDAAQIQYMPLVILFLMRYEREKSLVNLTLLFFFLFLSVFSFGYYAVLTIVMVALYFFYIRIVPYVLSHLHTKDSMLPGRSEGTGIVKLYTEPISIFLHTVFIFLFLVLAVNTLELMVPVPGLFVLAAFVALLLVVTDLKKILKRLSKDLLERVRTGDSRHFYLLVLAVLALPVMVYIFLAPIFTQASREISSSYIVPFLCFLVPSPDHPLLGGMLPDVLIPSPDPLAGKMVHIGVVLLSLVFVSMVNRRKRDSKRQFFFIILLTGVLLSIPPVIRINDFTFYGPMYYLHSLVPPFVDVRRVVTLMLLASCVLAAAGLKDLLQSIPGHPAKALVSAALVLFIGMEFYPDIAPRDMTKYPEAYTWLAQKKGDFTIIEYPLTSISDVRRYETFYGQTIHKKRLVNPFGAVGHDPRPDNNLLKDLVERGGPLREIFANTGTAASTLAYLNVRYVVVRKDKIGEVPELDQNALRKVADFSDSSIYETKAEPGKIFFTLSDFSRSGYFLSRPGPKKKSYGTGNPYIRPDMTWKDGKVWLWMGRKAWLRIWGLDGKETAIDLKFSARTVESPTRLKVTANGKTLDEFSVGPEENVFFIRNLRIRPSERKFAITFEVMDESALKYVEAFTEARNTAKGAAFLGVGFTGMVLNESAGNGELETEPDYIPYDGLYIRQI